MLVTCPHCGREIEITIQEANVYSWPMPGLLNDEAMLMLLEEGTEEEDEGDES